MRPARVGGCGCGGVRAAGTWTFFRSGLKSEMRRAGAWGDTPGHPPEWRQRGRGQHCAFWAAAAAAAAAAEAAASSNSTGVHRDGGWPQATNWSRFFHS